MSHESIKSRLLNCPRVKLADGNAIPILGLGVYQAKGREALDACVWALKAGYRHIDTAELYANEAEVGQAIKESGVPREEIYITTKVWNSSQGFDATIASCKDSLKKLGTTYIDLYLIHSPQEGTRAETWRAMEQLQRDGLVKSIGVSNYGVHHLKEMDGYAKVKPVINQLELHPFLQRREIVAECQKRGIAVEPWGSLTRVRRSSLLLLPKLTSLSAPLGQVHVRPARRIDRPKAWQIGGASLAPLGDPEELHRFA